MMDLFYTKSTLELLFLSLFVALILSSPVSAEQKNDLVGKWQGRQGTAEFTVDGILTYDGETYKYSIAGDVLTLLGSGGVIYAPFTLTGDTLDVIVNGQRQTFARNSSRASIDNKDILASPAELAGKWCYMSNVNAQNGGRISNRCFTLNENGTYTYYGETSSSGQYGSSATQESDRGRWEATATTLTSHSSSNGTHRYRLQKRNHPKTGDPMLVIDGDAYVTYYQRRPW